MATEEADKEEEAKHSRQNIAVNAGHKTDKSEVPRAA